MRENGEAAEDKLVLVQVLCLFCASAVERRHLLAFQSKTLVPGAAAMRLFHLRCLFDMKMQMLRAWPNHLVSNLHKTTRFRLNWYTELNWLKVIFEGPIQPLLGKQPHLVTSVDVHQMKNYEKRNKKAKILILQWDSWVVICPCQVSDWASWFFWSSHQHKTKSGTSG